MGKTSQIEPAEVDRKHMTLCMHKWKETRDEEKQVISSATKYLIINTTVLHAIA